MPLKVPLFYDHLVQLMAWCWIEDKPLPKPVVVQFTNALYDTNLWYVKLPFWSLIFKHIFSNENIIMSVTSFQRYDWWWNYAYVKKMARTLLGDNSLSADMMTSTSQKQVSRAWISNHIQLNAVTCNYLTRLFGVCHVLIWPIHGHCDKNMWQKMAPNNPFENGMVIQTITWVAYWQMWNMPDVEHWLQTFFLTDWYIGLRVTHQFIRKADIRK